MGYGLVWYGASDKNLPWYDLRGRKLQQKPSRKGVYILKGRKIVR